MTRFNLSSLILLAFFTSCNKEDDHPIDPQIASMVEDAKNVLHPLQRHAPGWADEDLRFLDIYSEKSVVGLGEATHGTAEFFDAKHRILKYLVENHEFKVFAIEADFGESVYINDAIQESRTGDLRQLMIEKMHFWTWKTEEVLDLVEWMSEYNRGKEDENKIHYIGVDCQYNTFNPLLLKQYLVSAHAPFIAFAETILDEAQAGKTYNISQFELFRNQLDALEDSLVHYKEMLIANSSSREFDFNLRTLIVVRQASEVKFRYSISDYSRNYRDEFMAENTAWIKEYFGGSKTVLWAHNYHVAKASTNGYHTQGYYLDKLLSTDYSSIAFMFNKGGFNAMRLEDGNIVGLTSFTITAEPKENSFNDVFSNIDNATFSVDVADLLALDSWKSSIYDLQYINIGSTFDGNIEEYYSLFDVDHYDKIIYFENTLPSKFIW